MINCFIIARLSSKRLPKKNILEINNIPMIIHLVNRIKHSKYIKKIIICTSVEKSDDELADLCKKNNLHCYRGSLENIMERICSAASSYETEHIVEILGDNPLIDFEIIDDVIELYLKNNLDYAANISKDYSYQISLGTYKCFPIGIRVQIYKYKIAKQYKNFLNQSFMSKHPTNFIFENNKLFNTGYLEAKDKYSFFELPEINLAVNEKYQFDNIKEIFKYFNYNYFSLKNIKNFFEKNNFLAKL